MSFFLSAHETFSRRDHILEHKSNLGKFKKIKIFSSVFSNYNIKGLEINYRSKNAKKKKIKHMMVKQYVMKYPVDHWRNQRENLK